MDGTLCWANDLLGMFIAHIIGANGNKRDISTLHWPHTCWCHGREMLVRSTGLMQWAPFTKGQWCRALMFPLMSDIYILQKRKGIRLAFRVVQPLWNITGICCLDTCQMLKWHNNYDTQSLLTMSWPRWYYKWPFRSCQTSWWLLLKTPHLCDLSYSPKSQHLSHNIYDLKHLRHLA